MLCVAQYSVDDRWYRAKVVDIPGKKTVTVQYVDFGNIEILSYSKIKALQTSFITLPQQVSTMNN